MGPLDTLDHGGFIAIDLETTGLDRRRDRIVALAAVRFVGGEATPVLVTLVNPGRSIPPSSTAIHGIDDAMVVDAPAEAPVVRRLDELCAGQVIVGHDLAFDLAILRRARQGVEAAPPPLAMLCTKRLAASLQPPWRHATLEALCAASGVSIEGRHTAEGDAVTAGRLLLALLPRVRARGIRTLGELLWLQETADG